MPLLDSPFNSGPQIRQLSFSPWHMSPPVHSNGAPSVLLTKEGSISLFHFALVPYHSFLIPSFHRKAQDVFISGATFLWVFWENLHCSHSLAVRHFLHPALAYSVTPTFLSGDPSLWVIQLVATSLINVNVPYYYWLLGRESPISVPLPWQNSAVTLRNH